MRTRPYASSTMFETNQKKNVMESGMDVETAYKVVLVLYLSTVL
jgi:hypothetical protein